MLVGRRPTRTSPERRARETGHHTQRLAHDLVHAARGDVGREAGVFDRRADRDAVIGPRNHVVAVDLLHDRPAPGVVIGDAEVRDLAAYRSDGKMHTELLTEPARPRAARDHHRRSPGSRHRRRRPSPGSPARTSSTEPARV